VPGDDKVVKNPYIHQCQSLYQRPGQQYIRFAGGGRSRWVIVGQHDGGSVARQRFPHHFARINAGMGLSTLNAKKVFLREQASFCNSRSGSGFLGGRNGIYREVSNNI